jgi:HB1, ASXL, restriction endonuclease HTH domain
MQAMPYAIVEGPEMTNEMPAAYSKTLRDLRNELVHLDARRQQVDAAIAAIEALAQAEHRLRRPTPRRSGRRTTRPTQTPTPKKFGGLSIVAAAQNVLREAGGGPMGADEIIGMIKAKRLIHRDIRRTSVVSALDRKANARETFVKPGPGRYALLGKNGEGS